MEPNPYCAALPVFKLNSYLDDNARDTQGVQRLCEAVATCLKDAGALVIRDPRVDSSENDHFIDLMERYFGQSTEAKMADVRSHLAYQVGATPDGIEKPRCLHDKAILEQAAALPPEDRPTVPTAADVKWRFFWRLGERPLDTRYKELNAEPVVPAAFPEWQEVMDGWGYKMLAAVATAAEMVARGFGLEPDAFTQRMRLGPHLLAPTGADLDKYGSIGTAFAGFHYDLNFLTIHGRSRFPGLHIWLSNGRRVPVRIPDGCLLIQAGKQMEWLTGGAVKAGFHEVVCTEETVAAAEAARRAGRSTWRVSSTVFSQIASDEVLRPLGPFATEQALKAYPEVPAGSYVQSELEAINLRAAE